MKTRSLANHSNVTRGFDLASLVIAFVLSAWLAAGDGRNMPFQEVLAIRIKLHNVILLIGIVGLWSAILSAFGLYKTYIYPRKLGDLKSTVAAISCCAGVLWLCHLCFRIALVGPEFLLDFCLLALSISITGRLALIHAWRNGRNLRQLLIVGTGVRAIDLARRVESTPGLGYRLVGLVDEHWVGSENCRRAGYAVVTDFEGFPDFIAAHIIDEVIVAMPVKSLYGRSSRILSQCREQGITARFISDLFPPDLGRSYVEQFDDRLVITIDSGAMRGWTVAVKRLIDTTVAAVALIALSPLMLLIALMIKAVSPGPVFFVQQRVGLHKRPFKLWKFRTMVPDAEARIAELLAVNEVSGPVFKIRDDPRITRIGRILRQTSLDELPQLFNVLRGEMSLVGPRPLPMRDYELFSNACHRRRFSVKPGITCLWQVMGRSRVPFDRWMELDMEYIDRWSLLLDLRILLKTIPAVVRRSGAS